MGLEIARMARQLGVSRSGYDDRAAEQRRRDLTVKIVTHHANSDQVYGSPRLLADLREARE